MILLHVDLKPKPGAGAPLEETFRDVFRPAISSQPGFDHVGLLRPLENGDEYRLEIAFVDRPSQQEWVATEVHQAVWPQMEGHCESYSVRYFDIV